MQNLFDEIRRENLPRIDSLYFDSLSLNFVLIFQLCDLVLGLVQVFQAYCRYRKVVLLHHAHEALSRHRILRQRLGLD